MQQIISDRPYEFVPPYHGRFWNALIRAFLPQYLDKAHGITSVECRGVDRLKASLAAGHGVLLTPNHCRPADPFVMGMLSRDVGRPFFTVASWHLFTRSKMQTFFLRRAGAFSIYREGMDRAAVNASIEILEQGRRPLVIFPEGLISRTNDHLGGLMEGTALIARTAAKRRAKVGTGDSDSHDPADKSHGRGAGQSSSGDGPPPGSADGPGKKVVVHPVAIRYFFKGDLRQAIDPVLEEIEARLTWRPRRGEELYARIYRIGEALLSLKEVEYFGRPRAGTIAERLVSLIDQLLVPMEKEWLNGSREPHTAARVKRLRQAILPDMVKGDLNDAERDRRWRQLADLYLVQQLALYPADYVRSHAVAERLLETVERFEEDITDRVRLHRPIQTLVQVGEAIEVTPGRERGAAADPLMKQVEEQMRAMLAQLASEAGPVMELGEPGRPGPAASTNRSGS